MFGSIEIVDLLVDRGADVRSRDDAWVTPVHEACAAGHIKVTSLFYSLILYV